MISLQWHDPFVFPEIYMYNANRFFVFALEVRRYPFGSRTYRSMNMSLSSDIQLRHLSLSHCLLLIVMHLYPTQNTFISSVIGLKYVILAL